MSLDCPIGCDQLKLNPKFDECTPDLKFGEIEEIAVAANDFAGFTDVTDQAEWATHIAAGDIEILIVKGTMDEPDTEEYEGTKGKTYYGQPTFTVPFEIHDLTDENWLMMRKTYCNSQHKVWLLTQNYVMGGNEGISEVNFKMWVAIETGRTSLNKIMGQLKFRAEAVPERTDLPGIGS
jgi:hypothetical protein